jgi:hypothetical protein
MMSTLLPEDKLIVQELANEARIFARLADLDRRFKGSMADEFEVEARTLRRAARMVFEMKRRRG